MTIQERIKAKETDMRDAASLGEHAERLKAVTAYARLRRTTADHERSQYWTIDFEVAVKSASNYTFSTEALAKEFLPELEAVARDLKASIADSLAPVIHDIEELAGKLIGQTPTVTVQSNGVNVEVR